MKARRRPDQMPDKRRGSSSFLSITHMFLAMALLKSGRIEEAAEHFRETVRITPGEAQAHYGLGCALAMQGKPGEAAQELREALRLRPDYAEPRDLLQKLEGKRE